METFHVNDTGVAFTGTIKDRDTGLAIDISTASTMVMWFEKPQLDTETVAPVLEKTANLATDGKDGKIRYVTVDGDLDRDGTWKLQGYVVVGGEKIHSDVQKFKVLVNLK